MENINLKLEQLNGNEIIIREGEALAPVAPVKLQLAGDIFTLILFMKYCDLETKLIKAGKKENHIGTKYVNDTKNNIEILDSTWFTTIVRSDGFHVRGHFRMQPYGPDMSQKKLIWINDFDKSGYTKRARILNEKRDCEQSPA